MNAPTIKVLIIDDEPPIRKLLRMGLNTQGYEILEASNGKTALDLLSQQPALVILDLGLPDIQGHELLRIIRERNESVPIVVLSSRDDEAGNGREEGERGGPGMADRRCGAVDEKRDQHRSRHEAKRGAEAGFLQGFEQVAHGNPPDDPEGRTVPRSPGEVKCSTATPAENSARNGRPVLSMADDAL